MSKIKNGTFNVEFKEKQILWTDKKRILGLPISFTKYTLTEDKLIINSGFFNLKEDEILLYRIRDLGLMETLFDRLYKVGTIQISSTDITLPKFEIKHVKNPKKVKEVLSLSIEANKRKNGIRATEIMNTSFGDNMENVDLDGDGISDAVEHMQDANVNNIPDCLEN